MSVLDLAKAKAHLNISGTGHDGELQDFIDRAEGAIKEKCGPLTPVEVTERVASSGGRGLVLRTTPVIALTSVTPVGGSAYSLSGLEIDESAGVIEWANGQRFTRGRYVVVYQAGRVEVPKDLLLGVAELVRHFWETQRGPTMRPGSRASEGAANTIPGAAHAWPFRVTELVAPYVQVGN
ncbi:phage head-tail connector protein [Nocardioides sp.]|uniref:phage head-tail connector protein n=1 Tax=Nocardioides sp. TaxID=35761 RepID=UPI0035B06443